MHFWAVLALFSALIVWSVWVRVCNLRAVDPSKVKSTPFSAAVQELVATAGGVYLSLIALVSFLRLDVPEKVTFGVTFDPLALLAICVAVTQPWWRRLFPVDNE